MTKQKYDTCIHAKEMGQQAVYVYPSCPHGTNIKGTLVSSKMRCRKCREWKNRKAEDEK